MAIILDKETGTFKGLPAGRQVQGFHDVRRFRCDGPVPLLYVR
jgi:hypothetical protein